MVLKFAPFIFVVKDQIAFAGSISASGPSTNQNLDSLNEGGLTPERKDSIAFRTIARDVIV